MVLYLAFLVPLIAHVILKVVYFKTQIRMLVNVTLETSAATVTRTVQTPLISVSPMGDLATVFPAALILLATAVIPTQIPLAPVYHSRAARPF